MATTEKLDVCHRLWNTTGSNVAAVALLAVVFITTAAPAQRVRIEDVQAQVASIENNVDKLQRDVLDLGDALRRELADSFERLHKELVSAADRQAHAVASVSRLTEHLQRIDQQLATLERRAAALEEQVAAMKSGGGDDVAQLRKDMERNYNNLAQQLKQSIDNTNKALQALGAAPAPGGSSRGTSGGSGTPGAAAGQKIRGTYTVQSGDTLRAIANEFGVTPEALMKANKITDAKTLRVGQELLIPEP